MSFASAWGGPDGAGGPHVFVSDLELLQLDDADRHHLERSLRLRPGDPLTASDGRGSWRRCSFGADLTPETAITFVEPPSTALQIGFALTKGAKPELVVQKLTELGIDTIVPFVAGRSVARWDESKRARQQARLERVAREAAMQSRQVRLPLVGPLATFEQLALPGVVRAERGGDRLGEEHTAVLVGPEGGWGAQEASTLGQVALSPHVLRAETAAIAAATLMTAVRSTAVR